MGRSSMTWSRPTSPLIVRSWMRSIFSWTCVTVIRGYKGFINYPETLDHRIIENVRTSQKERQRSSLQVGGRRDWMMHKRFSDKAVLKTFFWKDIHSGCGVIIHFSKSSILPGIPPSIRNFSSKHRGEKISSLAWNLINSVPQPATTTFTFASVRILFYRWWMLTWYSGTLRRNLFTLEMREVWSFRNQP